MLRVAGEKSTLLVPLPWIGFFNRHHFVGGRNLNVTSSLVIRMHRKPHKSGLSRRTFSRTCLATAGLFATQSLQNGSAAFAEGKDNKLPCFIATWKFGQQATDLSLKTSKQGGSVLDSVEQGIRLVEADRKNTSVGDGGTPAANGIVQLDACIMNGPGHGAGSVAGIEGIRHPISVARKVMEQTPHVLLVGKGAQDFAVSQGFEVSDLLTPGRKKAWEAWKAKQVDKPDLPIGADNHDTIALVGVGTDSQGNTVVAGGCSTSGLGYKLPGRVGDSPILGSGLYVDNEVGAAGATGIGENVMRYCSTFFIVEQMRAGKSPEEACVAAIERVDRIDPFDLKDLHINFLAIDREGNVGAAGTDKGFQYSIARPGVSEVRNAKWIH